MRLVWSWTVVRALYCAGGLWPLKPTYGCNILETRTGDSGCGHSETQATEKPCLYYSGQEAIGQLNGLEQQG